MDAQEPPPYIYAATDIRPRQPREIELCAKASHFDWLYTGTFLLGFVGSVYLDVKPLKGANDRAVRLIGPGLVGFTVGGLLSGAYLSLPKCDPLWAGGPPPEGNTRIHWPIALTITVISGVMGPVMDYSFLGPIKRDWTVPERSWRVAIAAAAGVLGSLFPYLLPPKTWAARKEIDRIRLEGTPSGATLYYTVQF